MKKSIFFILGILLICNISNAQYRLNKTQYDHKTYVYQVGDPYHPTIAGVASFFLPGLGQMISGEGVRGVGFLAGFAGCVTIIFVGALSTIDDIHYGGGDGSSGERLMFVGLGGAVGVSIWSIVDAVHVAKVNNLAFREQNKSSINFKLEPFIFNASTLNNKNNVSTGLSFKMTF